MKGIAICIIFLMTSKSLHAQEKWVLVGATIDKKSIYYIDNNYASSKQGIITVRFKCTYVEDRATDYTLHEIDCAQLKWRIIQIKAYNPDGKLLEERETPGPWLTPEPGSFASKMFFQACTKPN